MKTANRNAENGMNVKSVIAGEIAMNDYYICGCDYCRETFYELVETGLAWVLGREPNEFELSRVITEAEEVFSNKEN